MWIFIFCERRQVYSWDLWYPCTPILNLYKKVKFQWLNTFMRFSHRERERERVWVGGWVRVHACMCALCVSNLLITDTETDYRLIALGSMSHVFWFVTQHRPTAQGLCSWILLLQGCTVKPNNHSAGLVLTCIWLKSSVEMKSFKYLFSLKSLCSKGQKQNNPRRIRRQEQILWLLAFKMGRFLQIVSLECS